MESHLKLKIVEYQEAWANTRHYDNIYRYTLLITLSFSFASIALYADGKYYGIYACVLGLFFSVFSFLSLEKITWHYDRALSIIKNIENEFNTRILNNGDISRMRLGIVDKELEKPPTIITVIKNKTMGSSILVLNIIFLLLLISHYFIPK